MHKQTHTLTLTALTLTPSIPTSCRQGCLPPDPVARCMSARPAFSRGWAIAQRRVFSTICPSSR